MGLFMVLWKSVTPSRARPDRFCLQVLLYGLLLVKNPLPVLDVLRALRLHSFVGQSLGFQAIDKLNLFRRQVFLSLQPLHFRDRSKQALQGVINVVGKYLLRCHKFSLEWIIRY